MPNRRTHASVGVCAGASVASWNARSQTDTDRLVETVGGALGGYCGGLLPDVLEPAISPRHRDMAHSFAALIGVSALRVDGARNHCRREAERFHQLADSFGVSAEQRLLYRLAELLWRLAAGVVSGLPVAYASHLVLDGGTAAGLPLIATALF